MTNVAGSIGAAIIAVASLTSPAAAQKTVTEAGATVSVTAAIREIDAAKQYVVLRSDEDGSDVGLFAPPEFARFNELRVGDRVTITYYESIVYRLRRPGSPRSPVSEEVAEAESKSALPGATYSHQLTESVTVKAVDPDHSSITVIGRDGRAVVRRVNDISNLEGIKPGDRIDITYTEALLAAVTRAK